MSKVERPAGEARARVLGEGAWLEGMASGAVGMALWAVGYAGYQSSKPGGRDWSKWKSGSGSASTGSKAGV